MGVVERIGMVGVDKEDKPKEAIVIHQTITICRNEN